MVLRTQEANVTALVMTEGPMELYVDLCSVLFFFFFFAVVVAVLGVGHGVFYMVIEQSTTELFSQA